MLNKIISFGLGPVLSILVGLITVPALSWFFDPSDLGKMNLFLTLMAGATNILVLGLDQSYVRFYGQYENKKSLFLSCLAPQIISLFVISLFVIYVEFKYKYISDLFYINDDVIFFLIVISFWLIVLIRMLSLLPRMKGKGYTFSSIQIVRKLTILLIIPFIIFFKTTSGSETILLQSLSIILTFFFASYVSLKCLNDNDRWKLLPKDEFRRILKYSSPLIISGCIFWMLISMDRLALRFFHGISELGVYAVAISLSAYMTVFQSIFSTIWAPVGFKWFENGEIKDKFIQANSYITYIVSILILSYLLLSNFVYVILPPNYSNAVDISKLIIMYPYFYIISEVGGIGLSLEKKTKKIALIMIFCGCANIILNYLLTPRFGALGAASTIAFTFFIYMILKCYLSSKLGHKYMSLKSFLLTVIILVICLMDTFLGGFFVKVIEVFLLCYFIFKLFKDKKILINLGRTTYD
ncbi:lipopolysaccharide biosynthesis protein [Vibrio splendidus]|uniref:lipopolysaccharide biosynthesis protein n=1 Tax=Vibrio splendidus TaxID=29497 RepID=UPI000C84AEAF|nr:oligosaccharide flippase family protein [Vibrio splendidus]PMH70891.1 hypothetical protein BCU61_06180 [Vibrio splendidus]